MNSQQEKEIVIKLKQNQKVYFASDVHLGAPQSESKAREKRFVRWLDTIKHDAAAIYLVGDLFDFWFEYNDVVPKGYVRTLGKLAELRDAGIPIYFFVGNHDLWMFGYFEEELGITVYHQPQTIKIGDKSFFIAHGDGLGPGDNGYKLLKKWFFTNGFCQWLLSIVHPNFTMRLASLLSHKSRKAGDGDEHLVGTEKDRLLRYAQRKIKQQPDIDYFIFGHQHQPTNIELTNNSTYINLGDWIKHFSYAEFYEQHLEIKYFNNL